MAPSNTHPPPPPLRFEDFGYQKIEGAPDPAPLEPPPFTLKDIRDSIPPHCFEKSMTRSMAYALMDLIKFFGTLWLGFIILPNLPDSLLLKMVAWSSYWLLLTAAMGGLSVIGHECLHGAFSESHTVNYIVGTLVHAIVLIPHHNWKATHRRHHTHSGHMDDEEVFVPPTRSSIQSTIVQNLEESPVYNLLALLFSGPLGWMPLYLIYNFAGPVKHRNENSNHFDPNATHFNSSEKLQIWSTNGTIGIVVVILLGSGWAHGVSNVVWYYGIPYFAFNSILVTLTLLHHTDTYLPHFRDQEWNFMRSALSTVDRSWGPVFDHISHYINPTHVVHHFFPSMPFYHAEEATEAMRKVLGKYYLRDDTPIWSAMWRATSNCRFVEDEGGIVFYKKNVGNVKSNSD